MCCIIYKCCRRFPRCEERCDRCCEKCLEGCFVCYWTVHPPRNKGVSPVEQSAGKRRRTEKHGDDVGEKEMARKIDSAVRKLSNGAFAQGPNRVLDLNDHNALREFGIENPTKSVPSTILQLTIKSQALTLDFKDPDILQEKGFDRLNHASPSVYNPSTPLPIEPKSDTTHPRRDDVEESNKQLLPITRDFANQLPQDADRRAIKATVITTSEPTERSSPEMMPQQASIDGHHFPYSEILQPKDSTAVHRIQDSGGRKVSGQDDYLGLNSSLRRTQEKQSRQRASAKSQEQRMRRQSGSTASHGSLIDLRKEHQEAMQKRADGGWPPNHPLSEGHGVDSECKPETSHEQKLSIKNLADFDRAHHPMDSVKRLESWDCPLWDPESSTSEHHDPNGSALRFPAQHIEPEVKRIPSSHADELADDFAKPRQHPRTRSRTRFLSFLSFEEQHRGRRLPSTGSRIREHRNGGPIIMDKRHVTMPQMDAGRDRKASGLLDATARRVRQRPRKSSKSHPQHRRNRNKRARFIPTLEPISSPDNTPNTTPTSGPTPPNSSSSSLLGRLFGGQRGGDSPDKIGKLIEELTRLLESIAADDFADDVKEGPALAEGNGASDSIPNIDGEAPSPDAPVARVKVGKSSGGPAEGYSGLPSTLSVPTLSPLQRRLGTLGISLRQRLDGRVNP